MKKQCIFLICQAVRTFAYSFVLQDKNVYVVVKDLRKTRGRYWQTRKEIESIEKDAWRKFDDFFHHHESYNGLCDIIDNEFERAKDLKQNFDDLWIITKHIAGRIQNYDSQRGNKNFDNIQCKSVLLRF